MLTTTQLRKVLNDVSEKVNGDSLQVDSVEVYFQKWLDGIAVRNSPATLERYRNAVKWFLINLQGKAKKPISSVTPQDVENFHNSRLKSGVANKNAIVDWPATFIPGFVATPNNRLTQRGTQSNRIQPNESAGVPRGQFQACGDALNSCARSRTTCHPLKRRIISYGFVT